MIRLRPTTSHISAGTIALVVFFASVAPSYGAFQFDNFSDISGLQLNGDAVPTLNGLDDPNVVIRLANAVAESSGSAFTQSTVDITSFATTFNFRILNAGGVPDSTGESGADGIAFVIQPNSPLALGGGGGGLGYLGITPSVAIELDTWLNPDLGDPNSNHIGIDTNGSLNSITTDAASGRFDDALLHSVSISYDGTTLVASSGDGFVSLPIDIPALIGNTDAFVGFTAATGGAFGHHDIVSWRWGDIPEPSSCLVWSLLSLTVGGVYRWRRRRVT